MSPRRAGILGRLKRLLCPSHSVEFPTSTLLPFYYGHKFSTQTSRLRSPLHPSPLPMVCRGPLFFRLSLLFGLLSLPPTPSSLGLRAIRALILRGTGVDMDLLNVFISYRLRPCPRVKSTEMFPDGGLLGVWWFFGGPPTVILTTTRFLHNSRSFRSFPLRKTRL